MQQLAKIAKDIKNFFSSSGLKLQIPVQLETKIIENSSLKESVENLYNELNIKYLVCEREFQIMELIKDTNKKMISAILISLNKEGLLNPQNILIIKNLLIKQEFIAILVNNFKLSGTIFYGYRQELTEILFHKLKLSWEISQIENLFKWLTAFYKIVSFSPVPFVKLPDMRFLVQNRTYIKNFVFEIIFKHTDPNELFKELTVFLFYIDHSLREKSIKQRLMKIDTQRQLVPAMEIIQKKTLRVLYYLNIWKRIKPISIENALYFLGEHFMVDIKLYFSLSIEQIINILIKKSSNSFVPLLEKAQILSESQIFNFKEIKKYSKLVLFLNINKKSALSYIIPYSPSYYLIIDLAYNIHDNFILLNTIKKFIKDTVRSYPNQKFNIRIKLKNTISSVIKDCPTEEKKIKQKIRANIIHHRHKEGFPFLFKAPYHNKANQNSQSLILRIPANP